MIGLLFLLLQGPAPPVFATSVETVYVDAFVARDERPVPGLGADDFVVRDNGIEQAVRLVPRDALPTTAVLALDTSWSLAGDKLGFVKQAAAAFVRGLRAQDRAALMRFSHDLVLAQEPTHEHERVLAAIERLQAAGFTSLVDAVWAALKRDWGPGRPMVVVFSDGADSASFLADEHLLQAARASRALLYVVGVDATRPTRRQGREPGEQSLLRRTAETTGGAYWTVSRHADLAASFHAVQQAVAASYLLAYEPAGVRRGGRHALDVQVRRPGLHVRARQEYFVAPDPPAER